MPIYGLLFPSVWDCFALVRITLDHLSYISPTLLTSIGAIYSVIFLFLPSLLI